MCNINRENVNELGKKFKHFQLVQVVGTDGQLHLCMLSGEMNVLTNYQVVEENMELMTDSDVINDTPDATL